MIRRALSLLACLVLTTSTLAAPPVVQDGFNRPPDVPAYVEMFDGYEAGSTPNELGDGSNDQGGTMPVLALQPADVPSTASGWKLAGGSAPAIGTPKFRSQGAHSHINRDDPIRNFGKPGTSHLHCYFGNVTTNAWSTYTAGRTRANQAAAAHRPASTVAGGPYNATGYWYPCPIKTIAGKQYAIPVSLATFYYESNPLHHLSRLPRGLRYVLGRNMDDPDDLLFKAEIAAANAQPGTAGRYEYKGDGFFGWACRAVGSLDIIPSPVYGSYSPQLKNLDGSDPWEGACVSGSVLVATLSAPMCYDGNNLWSPGGYKHLRQAVIDHYTGNNDACPKGWFQVPTFLVNLQFWHKGFADYGAWRLSSDDMAATARGSPVPNGWSMHTDWLGMWDDTVFFDGWQKTCLGVDGTTTHECDSSTFDATGGKQTLKGSGDNAPDNSRRPQVNLSYKRNTDNVRELVLVPPTTMPQTIHAH